MQAPAPRALQLTSHIHGTFPPMRSARPPDPLPFQLLPSRQTHVRLNSELSYPYDHKFTVAMPSRLPSLEAQCQLPGILPSEHLPGSARIDERRTKRQISQTFRVPFISSVSLINPCPTASKQFTRLYTLLSSHDRHEKSRFASANQPLSPIKQCLQRPARLRSCIREIPTPTSPAQASL